MKKLNEWFHKPLGQEVIEGIQKQWEVFEPLGLFTYGNCLQIGTSVPILPIKKTTVLTSELILETHIVSLTDSLPFENESFSTIFLPFTLEWANNMYDLLDEAKRVLQPNGLLCIVGINPFSLWGGARLMRSSIMAPFFTHSYSSLRVYAALSMRNFSIHGIKSFMYRPPLSSKNVLKKIRYLEPIGQMFWPYPGGLYFLLAQKVTPQLLTVAPLWKSGGYVFGKA